MSVVVPLGKRESSSLEFKSKDALQEPGTIAREVVAFLNSGGGEVWVGLREEKGLAVTPEGIGDPEVQRRRLLDFLVDSLEPAPLDSEIQIEVVESPGGASLLRIRCSTKPSRGPYALLKQTGRHYLTRVADRIRPLSRQEVREIFARSEVSEEKGTDELERALQEELERQRETASSSGVGFLWLHFELGGSTQLDLDKLLESDYLTDPAKTDNRRSGSNFTAAYQIGRRKPELRNGDSGIHIFVGKEDDFDLRLHQSGRFTFRVPLVNLAVHPYPRDTVRCQLGSVELLEYPISFSRLAGHIAGNQDLWSGGATPAGPVLAQFAVFGLEGWGLRPGSVRSAGDVWAYGRRPPRVFKNKDFALERPLRFSMEEVRARPDSCGFRLVRQLYMAFGYALQEMPPEFDQRLGRLFLSD